MDKKKKQRFYVNRNTALYYSLLYTVYIMIQRDRQIEYATYNSIW